MSSGESSRVNFNIPRAVQGLALTVAIGTLATGCASEDARMATVPVEAKNAGMRWSSAKIPGQSFYINRDQARDIDCGARYVSGNFAEDNLSGKQVVENEKDVFKFNDSTLLIVCGGLAKNKYRLKS